MDMMYACAVVALTIVVGGLMLYRSLRTKSPVRVNCWFCNEDSVVPYGNQNCWDCPKCEQYNGFAQDGDYNKPIPAQYNENLNHPVSTINRPRIHQPSLNQLCAACNRNQLLKMKQLANFVPYNMVTYDAEVERYARDLDFVYRPCDDCAVRVKAELEAQHRDLRLGELLEGHAQAIQERREQEQEQEEMERSSMEQAVSCPWSVRILRASSLACGAALMAAPWLLEPAPEYRTGGALSGLCLALAAVLLAGPHSVLVCDAMGCVAWLGALVAAVFPFPPAQTPTATAATTLALWCLCANRSHRHATLLRRRRWLNNNTSFNSSTASSIANNSLDQSSVHSGSSSRKRSPNHPPLNPPALNGVRVKQEPVEGGRKNSRQTGSRTEGGGRNSSQDNRLEGGRMNSQQNGSRTEGGGRNSQQNSSRTEGGGRNSSQNNSLQGGRNSLEGGRMNGLQNNSLEGGRSNSSQDNSLQGGRSSLEGGRTNSLQNNTLEGGRSSQNHSTRDGNRLIHSLQTKSSDGRSNVQKPPGDIINNANVFASLTLGASVNTQQRQNRGLFSYHPPATATPATSVTSRPDPIFHQRPLISPTRFVATRPSGNHGNTVRQRGFGFGSDLFGQNFAFPAQSFSSLRPRPEPSTTPLSIDEDEENEDRFSLFSVPRDARESTYSSDSDDGDSGSDDDDSISGNRPPLPPVVPASSPATRETKQAKSGSATAKSKTKSEQKQDEPAKESSSSLVVSLWQMILWTCAMVNIVLAGCYLARTEVWMETLNNLMNFTNEVSTMKT